MGESFDAFRYFGHMRLHWHWIAGSCAAAFTVALAASMVMPREYTATARIVIEPPAGTDLRSAMAVSPIYLESLRTYEEFASSDSQFQKALERFGLRRELGSQPIEGLKKRVLRVDIVRNTRVMEIAVTIPDAHKAQALARFLAESTVQLNRSMVIESDQELLQGVEQQEREIRAHLQEVESAWAQLVANEPIDSLQSAIEETSDLRTNIQQQMQSVELELADTAERAKDTAGAELSNLHKEQSNAQARLGELQKQLQTLNRQNGERERTLALRLAHRDKLESERKIGQAALAAIGTRLREARGDAGFRGERLKIIDPGIVPERPSSPNIPLNLAAALFLGFVLPVLYLTLLMSYQEQRAGSRRSGFHAVAKSRDE